MECEMEELREEVRGGREGGREGKRKIEIVISTYLNVQLSEAQLQNSSLQAFLSILQDDYNRALDVLPPPPRPPPPPPPSLPSSLPPSSHLIEEAVNRARVGAEAEHARQLEAKERSLM